MQQGFTRRGKDGSSEIRDQHFVCMQQQESHTEPRFCDRSVVIRPDQRQEAWTKSNIFANLLPVHCKQQLAAGIFSAGALSYEPENEAFLTYVHTLVFLKWHLPL